MAAARMVWDGATMAADKMRAVEGLRLRVGGACAAEGCGLRLRGTRGIGRRVCVGLYRRQEVTIRPRRRCVWRVAAQGAARRCSVRVSAAWHEVGWRASMGPAHLAWMWVGSRSAQMK